MRSRSGNNLLFSVFIVAIGFFFPSTTIIAQDTIPQGTIKVRRAPIPSQYRVEVSYEYHWRKPPPIFHFLDFQKEPAFLQSPDPFVYEPEVNDSNRTLEDSTFALNFYNRMGRPAEEFDWSQWLSGYYVHTFEWDDTAGIDSTTFVFEVNARGQAHSIPEPMGTRDTSAIRLQKKLRPAMEALWAWYPAESIDGDGKKPKKIACTVRVKVYAQKAGYGQNLPLEIVK